MGGAVVCQSQSNSGHNAGGVETWMTRDEKTVRVHFCTISLALVAQVITLVHHCASHVPQIFIKFTCVVVSIYAQQAYD